MLWVLRQNILCVYQLARIHKKGLQTFNAYVLSYSWRQLWLCQNSYSRKHYLKLDYLKLALSENWTKESVTHILKVWLICISWATSYYSVFCHISIVFTRFSDRVGTILWLAGINIIHYLQEFTKHKNVSRIRISWLLLVLQKACFFKLLMKNELKTKTIILFFIF